MAESQIAQLIRDKLGLGLNEVEEARGYFLTVNLGRITRMVIVRDRKVILHYIGGVVKEASCTVKDDCASIVVTFNGTVTRCTPEAELCVLATLTIRQFHDNEPVVELWFSGTDIIRLESPDKFSFEAPPQAESEVEGGMK